MPCPQVPVLSLVVPSPQPYPELLSLHQAAQTLANMLTYTPPPPASPLVGTEAIANEEHFCNILLSHNLYKPMLCIKFQTLK